MTHKSERANIQIQDAIRRMDMRAAGLDQFGRRLPGHEDRWRCDSCGDNPVGGDKCPYCSRPRHWSKFSNLEPND
jgi:rubrerythrin